MDYSLLAVYIGTVRLVGYCANTGLLDHLNVKISPEQVLLFGFASN